MIVKDHRVISWLENDGLLGNYAVFRLGATEFRFQAGWPGPRVEPGILGKRPIEAGLGRYSMEARIIRNCGIGNYPVAFSQQMPQGNRVGRIIRCNQPVYDGKQNGKI